MAAADRRATWRDLLWVTVNACGGWILAIVPAAVLALGLVSLNAPYASLEGPLQTIVAAVLGLWGAPWLLRGYGVLARSLLAPTGQAELALRVRQLSPDPHRGPRHRRRRNPPDRAGPARRSAGPAGRHGHDPGRGWADHRHQPGRGPGAARRGQRRLGEGAGRTARPGPRHPPAGAGRPWPSRRDPGADPGQPDADPPGQRAEGRPPPRSSRPPTSRSASCWPTCPSTPRPGRPGSISGTPTGCSGSASPTTATAAPTQARQRTARDRAAAGPVRRRARRQ